MSDRYVTGPLAVAACVVSLVVLAVSFHVLTQPETPSPVPSIPDNVHQVGDCPVELYVFREDGCPYCERMERIMATPTVREHLKPFSVHVIDGPSAPGLDYQAAVYPTFVIVREGRVLSTREGASSAEDFDAWLDKFAKCREAGLSIEGTVVQCRCLSIEEVHVGQVVRLRCGGPAMTVIAVNPVLHRGRVQCRWIDEDGDETDFFPPEILVAVN